MALIKLLSFTRIKKSAYHPAANGIIERVHNTMKAPIMCIVNKYNWNFHGRNGPVPIKSSPYNAELSKTFLEVCREKGYSVVNYNGPE